MTEYFAKCESVCTSMSLHRAALHYILEEFHSNPDLNFIGNPHDNVEKEEELYQLMFDKSPIKMRMYGSAKELVENVKIYKNFPGSDRRFKAHLEPYLTTPIIYTSLNNRKFIHKSDIFVMLQGMVARLYEEPQPELLIELITIFLKSKEKSLIGHVEFIPFERKVFDEIWKELDSMNTEFLLSIQSPPFGILRQALSNLNYDQFFVAIKNKIPNNWSALEVRRIKESISSFQEEVRTIDPVHVPFIKATVVTAAQKINKRLGEIIKKRPEMFLPRSAAGKTPVTVRLFEDGDKKFVMKAELFNALKINYTDQQHMYDTVMWNDVKDQYAHKNIEFIRYPIKRAKHKAVPINGVDLDDPDSFCILAVDALFDYLKRNIFELNLFQKADGSKWHMIENTLGQMESHFMSEMESPYFLRTTTLDYIGVMFRTQCKAIMAMPAKTIRNAKPDGFTVQNLKNELEHLGLTKLFPESLEYSGVVHAHVDKVKKEKYLRTCDLYDALEYCQLICIFERLPKYKKFLHNQGGCGRIPGLKCAFCDEKKKKQEDKNALEVEGPPVSNTSSIESNLPVQDINGVGSNNSAKALASSETHKEDSNAEELRAKELEEINLKIASLEAQLASQAEKSSEIESDILKKTQENEELHLSNVKLQSENEANKGVISQLIDKLSIKGSGHESAICLN